MILQFQPILKSIIWGGEQIATYKGLATEQKNIGESWELSGVAGDESIVATGPYEGQSLPQVIKVMGAKLLGHKNYERFGKEFPLLIKFIDAQDDLSIQVHPNDDLAAQLHGKKGKTEMWYIVQGSPDAKLRVGFNQQVSPEEYEEHIKKNTILDVLCEYTVSAGDVFFLPAGRIHSIGAGCFVAEIQQTSDLTYRIYDFCRKDKDGNERELHTELSKQAIDFRLQDDYQTRYASKKNEEVELASCPYFTTNLLDLDSPMDCDYSTLDSFVVLMCLAGGAKLKDADTCIAIKQGETVLIPAESAGLTITPTQQGVKLLSSYI